MGIVVRMVGLHRKAGPTTPKSGPQRYTLGLGFRVRVCVQEHSVITLGTPDSERRPRPNKSGQDFCKNRDLKKSKKRKIFKNGGMMKKIDCWKLGLNNDFDYFF